MRQYNKVKTVNPIYPITEINYKSRETRPAGCRGSSS